MTGSPRVFEQDSYDQLGRDELPLVRGTTGKHGDLAADEPGLALRVIETGLVGLTCEGGLCILAAQCLGETTVTHSC